MSRQHCLGARRILVSALVWTAAACGDDGGGGGASSRLEVAALFDGIAFEGGELRAGDIPAATSVMELEPTNLENQVLFLEPGQELVLDLSLEGPELDQQAMATLLQFDGTSSHVRIEAEEPAAELTVRGAVTADVCDSLCNTAYEVALVIAPELTGGEVGRHGVIDLIVDCSAAGRQEACTGSERTVNLPPDGGAPMSSDPDAGGPQPMADAGSGGGTGMVDAGGGSQPVADAGSGGSTDSGDAGSGNMTASNQPPSASAGDSRTAAEAAVVTLSGSGSDEDGSVESGMWVQRSGPTVTLLGSGDEVTFEAPSVSEPTVLTFAFVVTDDDGATTQDVVSITVLPDNLPPVADAGSDVGAVEGDSVMITGQATDADGSIASVGWQQLGGPAVSLAGTDTLTVSFTAPNVSMPTSIVLEFAATDDEGATDTDIVVVDVDPVNLPPTASAGGGQTVAEGDVVQLSGSASDPDGSVATVLWRQLFGQQVTLDDTGILAPSFTAPAPTAGLPETLRFELVVTDDEGGTDSSQVDVIVTPPAGGNQSPVAYAGPDQAVAPGSTVSFAGVASDSDGSITSVAWTQIAGTDVGAITGGDTLTGSFTAPSVSCAESLVFELEVQDDSGGVETDQVAIIVSQNLSGAPTLPADLDPEDADPGLFEADPPWERGVPTTGPLAAHTGTRVWATGLSTNYGDNLNAALCLPPVNRGGAAATLSFRLWSTFINNDGLRVQALDPDTGWTDLQPATPAYDGNGYWINQGYQNEYVLVLVPVPSWVGQFAQLRLLVTSNGSSNTTGAFVDDIRIDDEASDPDGDGIAGVLGEIELAQTDPFVADSDGDGESDGDELAAGSNPLIPTSDSGSPPLQPPVRLSFESGLDGVGTDGSLWQRGTPSSGPARAHEGTGVWATNLAGNYFPNAREHLYLPTIDLTGGGDATLSFRLWASSYNGDGLSIEVLQDGVWATLSVALPAYDGTDVTGAPVYRTQGYQDEYVLVAASLADYAGEEVSLRLTFRSGGGSGTLGAYVDEVRVDLESVDADGDGIDGVLAEIAAAQTDPFVADSDGDGESDGAEVSSGGDPLDPANGSGTVALVPGDFIDFETGGGGLATAGDLWEHGEPSSGPGMAYSGDALWATRLGGNYIANAREYLNLPPIDLTSATDPTLSVRLWSAVYNGDGMRFEVYDDVTGWTTLQAQSPAYDGTGPDGRMVYGSLGYQNEYVLAAASLANHVGEVVQVRLAFVSAGGSTIAGFYVDDLRIDEEGSDPDGDMFDGVLAELNVGLDPYVDDTDGDGELDGVEVMAGSDPLDPGQTSGVTPLLPGDFLSLDDDGGLATDGTLWQYGEVTAGPSRPSAPHTGSRAWMTGLNQNYFANAREYLYLPPIDLSGAPSDPATLSFRLWTLGYNGDGLSLEVYEDGLGWTPLGVEAPAYDGTDDTGAAAYVEQRYLEEFVLVAASLSPYAGETVRVRFAFRSGGGSTRAGAYIDDIAVTLETADPDMDGIDGVLVELIDEQTDPFVTDTDGDGVDDGDELIDGTDPTVGSDYIAASVWDPASGVSEDLEVDDGGLWTAGALFEYGAPGSGPGAAATGSRVWATGLSGNYFSDAREYLHLPPMDLSSASAPVLSFQLWCDGYSGDGLSVEVLDDALGWTHVATVTPSYDGTDVSGLAAWQVQGSGSSYQLVDVDLSGWTGAGNERRLFRFAFRSNSGSTLAGCYLDDFTLSE